MFWIATTELSWPFALFVFSLVSIVSIGYFKFGHSFEGVHLPDFHLGLWSLLQKLRGKPNESNRLTAGPLASCAPDSETDRKYSTFVCKMSSVERKQSFIRRSLEGRRKPPPQPADAEPSESSFIYSSLFAFTKTLINRANPLTNSVKKQPQEAEQASAKPDAGQLAAVTISKQPAVSPLLSPNDDRAASPAARRLLRVKLPVHGTMSSANTMTTLNESAERPTGMSKSVSLQIKDEMRAIPRSRLLHQSSSSSHSSNSSTPADLFSLAEKGRVGANFRKHKPLINNKVYQQQPSTYTELVSQIQNHEDAINREYLLHQLNPSQYHSMHYRRLERQNCLGGKRTSGKKKIAKQDTAQSNSSNGGDNSNELEHLTSSSSNLSCSECGSLDTEEELTIPFMKKAGHYQPNVSLRSKQPLKLSSSLDKSGVIHPITKQASNDSNNEAIVGLLNENLIKRQLTNYMKLSDKLTDKLSEKRKRILGRRLTAQGSFSAANSFNNSSANSSFDHDDMLVQFAGNQANSFSSTDTNHAVFHYNHYENNSIHSNDTSSSSNSSCGHRHAERTKTLSDFEHALSICDNHAGPMADDQFNQPHLIEQECANNILHVTHAYDPTSRKLKIRIVKADFVPPKAEGDQRCYVKLFLLPNKRQKFKTSAKSCSSNPIEFDETFTFNRVSPEAIMTLSIKYLFCLVHDSKHRQVGEATIPFENRKPMQQEDSLIIYLPPTPGSLHCNYNVIPSQSVSKPSTANVNAESLSDVSSICRSDSAESHHSIQLNLPELLIGLAYNATTGRLQVTIVRGSQFKAKSNKPPDTYVKLTVLSSSGHEIGRNKTTVKRSSPNPVYKQTFAFQVALFQLPDVSLMISVYNKKSMNRKEMIGWFSMGCNSSGEEENSHWAEMRDSKGEQVGGYYSVVTTEKSSDINNKKCLVLILTLILSRSPADLPLARAVRVVEMQPHTTSTLGHLT